MKLQERRAEISAVINDVAAANWVGDIDGLITTQFWKCRYIFYQNTDFSFDLADFIDLISPIQKSLARLESDGSVGSVMKVKKFTRVTKKN